MREIRIALLEADVNYSVVKDFIAKISERAKGEEIVKSVTPGQQVVKIVSDELTELMGAKNAKLDVASKPPTVIMMCGLQGAGKTTMCGKLAALLKKQGKKPLLVACDIYRPAAIDQLEVVGRNAGTEVFAKGTQKPVKTAEQAVKYALSMGMDTVIIDTAGRLHINDDLMRELEDIRRALKPTEILLTVDAMTGTGRRYCRNGVQRQTGYYRRDPDETRRRHARRSGAFHPRRNGQAYQILRNG